MRIDARANEWKPVVELLESAEYDTAAALASAVIKQAYNTFLEREWWVVMWPGVAGGMPTTYGLFATEGAAKSAVEKNEVGLTGRVAILKIASAKDRVEYVLGH